MKKKVLGTLMIAALVASGSSALVSCKDTEGDDIQQTNNSIARLNADFQKQVKDLQDKIAAIKQCNCDKEAFNTLKNEVSTLQTNFADSSASWTNQFKALNEKIAKLPADNTSWEKVLDELQKTTIPNIVAKEAADSTLLQSQINKLNDFCDDLLGSLVTSDKIWSTYCPVVGSLNAQFLGLSANTFLTYYGNNANGEFAFPTNNTSFFYNDDEAATLTKDDLAGATTVTVPAGTLLDNNAGTVYITLNPSTVDLSGVKLALEKSNGDIYPLTLTNSGKVDTVFTYGYTRAGSTPFNVYAVKATLNQADLNKVKISVDATELKAAVKRLMTERDETKSSLKNLAKQSVKFVLDNMNTTQPILALTTESKIDDTSLKNVSAESFAAGAFKPLNFGAFDNLANADHIPGIGYAERHLHNFINSITLQTVKVYGTGLSTITHVNSLGKITKNADGTYKLTANVTGKQSNGTVARADGYLMLTASELTDLLNTVSTTPGSDLDKAIEAYNNNTIDVNNLLADLNESLSYSTAVDDVKAGAIGKIDTYFDNLNSRYAYWFNRVKKAALHPCMLFIGTNAQGVTGAHRLTAAGATVTGSSITLVPTSYTYNLLAPAYKKFVKVYSGSDKPLYNKVISGDTYSVNVEGLVSGKTYTVVYEAVDYTGKVMARKYALNVK